MFIVFAAIGMLFGSKLLFFITVLPTELNDITPKKALILFLNSGFVFYGGLFGALGCGILSGKISHEDMNKTLNIFIPPFVLFHTFGRIGCFFAGCCYGIECKLGFSYPDEPNVIRFPVQLAEALGNTIIIAILCYREKQLKNRDSLTFMYLLMYAPMRLLLEFLRGDAVRGYWGYISTSQWISIFIIVVLAVLLFRKYRKSRKASQYND